MDGELKVRTRKFRVKVGDEEYEFDTLKELRIDRHNLDEEIIKQAAHYAFFDVLYEYARSQRLDLEAKVERREYVVEQETRAAAAKSNQKTTEGSIKVAVRNDEERLHLLEELQEADAYERLLGAMVSALTQRQNMLTALSRSRYFEMSPFSATEISKIKNNLGS